MSECLNFVLGDDLDGVERNVGEITPTECDVAQCLVKLAFRGMGNEKPMLIRQSGECIDPRLND